MTKTARRIGVVLFQLGGPDSLEAIEPFLFNLFCDPDIIDFPLARIGRRPLAKLISSTRAKKVEHHYSVIGGCSPIRRFTEQQAVALERWLVEAGVDARCFVAMRYWHPFTAEAIEHIQAAECDDIVLLPLYPHYSGTTTGSSLNEWSRRYTGEAEVRVIEHFYKNELYLQSLIEKIGAALAEFPDPDGAEIVFSAHSVPLAVIRKGDPYQQHIEETVARVMERGGWPNRHRLCYQSKVGASKWLQPSLRDTIRELARDRVKDVCIVPISFVSDHVETLGEIDHEARELANSLGIERFVMTAGLNTSPTFIRALGEMVVEALSRNVSAAGARDEAACGERLVAAS